MRFNRVTQKESKMPRVQVGQRRPRAFSLVEIMVVIVIIGILAGAVAWNVTGHTADARKNRARSDIATIVEAVELYRLENGRYPSNTEGLSELDVKQHTLEDPWGRRYRYNKPGQNDAPFEVFTLGQDGREGGTGVNSDIYSWDLSEDANQGEGAPR
jgi:general secretion pathway protein G